MGAGRRRAGRGGGREDEGEVLVDFRVRLETGREREGEEEPCDRDPIPICL